MSAASKIGPAFAFLLAGVLTGIDAYDPFSKQLFNRLLDFQFVGARIDPKNILIMFFTQKACLLSESDIANQMRRFVHAILSANFANAASVTMIFSNASNCSVFTSDAVFNCTGCTFLAAL